MRTPNQRNRYAKLKGRLNKYSLAVQNIYDLLNVEAAKIATGTGFAGGVFRFSDYPMTADAVNRLQERFVREMRGLIYSGTSAEWKESNLVQDLLANDVLRSYGATIRGQKTQAYYQKNSDALRAFQERTERGMNLSTKLWNQSGNYKQELEYAISSAIEKGTSAVTLSKRLSKYLHDFPSLKADYKERFGQAVTCQDCEYRSIRLARTEINMAYRTAEQTRWKQMDFVVGFEVKLSFSHEITDICDSAQGKYPKDFVFMGWHPNCMCYTIPILKTESEFWSGDTGAPSVNEVTDVPTGFKQWVQDNQERLDVAEQRGTLPYWYQSNSVYVSTSDVISDNDIKERMIAYFEKNGEFIAQGDISIIDGCVKLNMPQFNAIGDSMAITDDEYDLIYPVIGRGYIYSKESFAINEALIKGQIITGENLKIVEALDDVISRNKLPFPIQVERNIGVGGIKSMFELGKDGVETIEEIDRALKAKGTPVGKSKGFCSTSAISNDNVSQRKPCVLVIDVPQNTNIFVSKNWIESECVLARDTELQYISSEVVDGKLIIRCRVIK